MLPAYVYWTEVVSYHITTHVHMRALTQARTHARTHRHEQFFERLTNGVRLYPCFRLQIKSKV